MGHYFFYPCPYKNCNNPVKTGFMAWFLDETNETAEDYMRKMAIQDRKAVQAFAIDQMFTPLARNDKGLPTQLTTSTSNSVYKIGLQSVNEDNNLNTALYIVGHCTPGADEILSPDEKVKCSVETLMGYFKDNLSTDFCGKIKLYGCETAKPSFWPGSQPFTQRVHDSMRKLGYNRCSFYGYTEAVSSWPTTMTDGSVHKHLKDKRSKTTRVPIQ